MLVAPPDAPYVLTTARKLSIATGGAGGVGPSARSQSESCRTSGGESAPGDGRGVNLDCLGVAWCGYGGDLLAGDGSVELAMVFLTSNKWQQVNEDGAASCDRLSKKCVL